MNIKVKCEHCWKVFEVENQVVNKKKRCPFCQCLTLVIPFEETKKKVSASSSEPGNSLKLSRKLNFLAIALLVLTFFNAVIVFVKSGPATANQNVFSDWQITVNQNIQRLAQKVDSYQQNLEQAKQSKDSPEQLALSLIKGIESSLKLIVERINDKEERMKQLKIKLETIKEEIKQMRKKMVSKK